MTCPYFGDSKGPYEHLEPLFEPGRIVATPAALVAIESALGSVGNYLILHLAGQWSQMSRADHETNLAAIQNGARILSRFVLYSKEVIYIITEADRSSTTVLLASEY